MDSPRTKESVKKKIDASIALDEWLAREELLWKQRARTDWLKSGEYNAVFFQGKSTKEKR